MRLEKAIERVSVEDNTKVDIEPAVELQAVPEELEIEPVGLVEVEASCEEIGAEIGEIEALGASLEQYSNYLNGAAARGGLRAEEAAMIGVGVGYIQKRVGFGESIIASLEEHNDSKAMLLKVSQEAVGRTAGELVKKFLELMYRLVQALKHAVEKFYKNSPKIRNICEFIKAKSRDWKGKSATVSLDGTILEPEDFRTNLKFLATYTDNYLKKSINTFESNILEAGKTISIALRSGTTPEDIYRNLVMWEYMHPLLFLKHTGNKAQLAKGVTVVIEEVKPVNKLFRGKNFNALVNITTPTSGLEVTINGNEIHEMSVNMLKVLTNMNDISEKFQSVSTNLEGLTRRLNAGELSGIDPENITVIRDIFIMISTQLGTQFNSVYSVCQRLMQQYSYTLAQASKKFETA